MVSDSVTVQHSTMATSSSGLGLITVGVLAGGNQPGDVANDGSAAGGQ